MFSDDARVEQFARLQSAQGDVLDLTNRHEFLKVPLRAGYRNGSLVTSQVGLIYSYALHLVGRRASRPEAFEVMRRDHALPDAWHEMDYDDFLAARRSLMAAVVRRGAERLGGPFAATGTAP